MLARLPLANVFPHDGQQQDSTSYQRADELLDDLSLLYDSLIEVGAWRLADNAVWPIIRAVQTFGFHLASLDIRQNSRFHDLAVAQLLAAVELKQADFSQWDESRRLALLNQELASPRPFLRSDMQAGIEARAVLSSYQVLVDYLRAYGQDGLGGSWSV
jgi:phosphoenolpyruvate carboxylase